MKIQNTNSSNVGGIGNTPGIAPNGATARQTPEASPEGDQVQISTLGTLARAVKSESSEHSSKVIQLSKTVAAGRYQVDPQALSNTLIDAHLGIAA